MVYTFNPVQIFNFVYRTKSYFSYIILFDIPQFRVHFTLNFDYKMASVTSLNGAEHQASLHFYVFKHIFQFQSFYFALGLLFDIY